MSGELFTLPGWLDRASPQKDAFKLTLAIQHSALDRNTLGALTQLCQTQSPAFLMIKTADFDPMELEIMEEIQVDKDDSKSTPSERMYKKIYVLWQKRKGKGTAAFDTFKPFYEHVMGLYEADLIKKIQREDQ